MTPVRDQVISQIWYRVRAQTSYKDLSDVQDQVWDQVRDQVGIQVLNQVQNQVWDHVRYQVWTKSGTKCNDSCS